MMNRLIQTARIADLSDDKEALKKIVKTVKERLEDWLKAEKQLYSELWHDCS